MNFTKIIIGIIAAVAISCFFLLDLGQYITLTALKTNHQLLMDYYAQHRYLMVAGFVSLYILQTALSLPGATMFSLAAGAIFGTLAGTIYAVFAATIGATLALLVTRYLLRNAVLTRFGSKLEGMNRELATRGFNYLLFLRLVPIFPFFLINLAAGLTRLPIRTFFFATLLGIVPGAFVYVNAGASLATITSLAGIASPRVIGAFAMLGLFALLPVLHARYQRRSS
jgi:uncharacterized membrane protein YdjX (TVP38/TMEM64 family)